MPGPQSQLGGLVGLVRSDGKLELSEGLTRGPQAWAKDTTTTPHTHTESLQMYQLLTNDQWTNMEI